MIWMRSRTRSGRRTCPALPKYLTAQANGAIARPTARTSPARGPGRADPQRTVRQWGAAVAEYRTLGLQSVFPTLMAYDDAIVRLAKQIDAARKSEPSLVNAEEVAALRRQGACRFEARPLNRCR